MEAKLKTESMHQPAEGEKKLVPRAFMPDSPELVAAGFKKISRPHSVESVDKYDATLTVRMWIKAGADISKVYVQTEDGIDSKPFISLISYRRDDATEAIGSPCVGVTLLVASQITEHAKKIKLSIVLSTKEILLLDTNLQRKEFSEIMEGISYDLGRRTGVVESYLSSSAGTPLLDFMKGVWKLYLQKNVERHSVLRVRAATPPSYSSVTVFYRNTALAEMFPLLSGVFDVGPEMELVLCFQEAVIFQKQIDWIRHMGQQLGLNLTIVLFESNVGFSAANNIGVMYSSGKAIQLLNPDIICTDPSVYKKILRRSESRDAIFGATLLGSGGDVMHNGISLNEEVVFNGMRPSTVLRTAHVARHAPAETIDEGGEIEVDAVTGALIATKRDLYIQLGGLSVDYIFAHFEDIDLCLRAAKLGIPTCVFQNIDITHVESISSGANGMSHVIKLANSVTFNKLYGAQK